MRSFKNLKRILSLLLVASFLLVLGGASALAEEVTEEVYLSASEGEVKEKTVESVKVETLATGAVEVDATNGGSAIINVEKDVTLEAANEEYVEATKAFARGEKSVSEINVGGDVSSSNSNGNAWSASVSTYNGGEAKTNIGGDVTAESAENAHAISVDSTGNESKSQMNVDGSVSAISSDNNAMGADVYSSDGGYSEIDIAGSVTTTSQLSGEALDVYSSGKGSEAVAVVKGNLISKSSEGQSTGVDMLATDSGSIDVSLGGGIKVESNAREKGGSYYSTAIDADGWGEGTSIKASVGGDVETIVTSKELTAEGVDVRTDEGAVIDITVNGSVTAKSAGNATGVYTDVWGGSENKTTITRNVTVASSDGRATGITANAGKGAKNEFTIEGDLKVESGHKDGEEGSGGNVSAIGILAGSEGAGSKTIGVVNGDIMVSSQGDYADGVEAYATKGGTIDLTINGSVTVSTLDDTTMAGLVINACGGSVDFIVGEDVVATGRDAESIHLDVGNIDSNKGTVRGAVKGDVSGGNAGLYVNNDSENEPGFASLTVEGTISAKEENGTAIVVGKAITEDNLELTVWKVDLDKDGDAVKQTDRGVKVSNETTQAIEKNINYIIRIAPAQTDIISIDQDTAKEGESVIVKLNVPAGYKVDGAFSDEGKSVRLLKDSNGNYYVEMPKGGGVYLSASLSEIPAEVVTTDYGNNATVKVADGKYVVILTGWQKSMTFVRSTLERFQKLSDTLIIKTDSGSCSVSISEILNLNEKAINFRFSFNGEALEVYADNVLAKTVGLAEFI